VTIGPAQVRRTVGRLGATLVNGLEVARFGGLRTDLEPSPFEVVGRAGIAQLRRYYADNVPEDAPVIVLVPPLMLTAEVWDVSPSTSAVASLHALGLDVFVVDFGSPEHTEGGIHRTLDEHVLAVSTSIDIITELRGRDVHLGGYSQGGMFCYQVAAYRRSEGIASVITFGSPVDVHGGLPFGIPSAQASELATRVARKVFESSAVPGWLTRTGFKMLDPVKTVRSRVEFIRQLHDRDSLIDREPQRRFLDGEGFIAWPGPALAEFAEQFIRHNRMLSGGFSIGDRMVTLADITAPVLTVVGEVDEIAAPAAVRAISKAAPGADVHELSLRTGHFGLVVGSRAADVTWPTVAGWVRHLDLDEPMPDAVGEPGSSEASHPMNARVPEAARVASMAAGFGFDLARSVVGTVARTVGGTGELAGSAAAVLPRLLRLERVDADTTVSLGSLLAEQARTRPSSTFFLFEGRGYSYADASVRVDNIVKGLLSLGVRQGEHVGVLMHTRPSGLATIVAISRLGAVAVMLRPDGDLAREVELGDVQRLVVDPEHAEVAATQLKIPVLVLGGGGQARELGLNVVDMERIDPDVVTVPAWYRANPGRASDLGFVLFTGSGSRTRANRISNGRWMLSALGTASAASLDESDTVYGITPLHHPSGLMTAIGGAIAGGARLALTAEHDPETFWTEVRRYGVTVVAYTWTLCRDLVNAPPDPREAHHPVRLFLGSGMPVSVWRRVLERFGPASVLEFYASTQGQAVLVNLDGRRVGAKGRPLPGSVDVAVVRYDMDARRLVVGADGFAARTAPGEVGLLLAKVPPETPAVSASPLRSVLAPGDAWSSTGDLFTVGTDGQHHLMGSVDALLRTDAGFVPVASVEDAVEWCPGVDLAVGYGLRLRSGRDLLVIAVTLVPGVEALDMDRLARTVIDRLPAGHVPTVIRIVKDVATTTWYRPMRGPLRDEGLPVTKAWVWHPADRCYEPLTAAHRDRLLAGERAFSR
jgi:putative long chain acyl-CoA synthase